MPGERTWDWESGPRRRRRWPDDGQRLPLLHGPHGGMRTVGPAAVSSDRRSLGATYNPMLGWERPRTVHPLRPRVEPAPGVALVLHRDDGVLHERMPADGSLSLGVVTDVRTVYRVDVSEHALGFRFRLPCSDDPHEFIADVDVTCVIVRPAQVVERRLTDVRRLLEPGLEELLRDVSGQFAVDDRPGAERTLRQELRQRAAAGGFDPAVRITAISVRVRLDEATAAHLNGLAELERRVGRSELYEALLERRDWSLLALYLERNPGNVQEVLAHISRQQELSVETRIKALKFLLDHDIVEAEQLSEAGEHGLLARDIIEALDLSHPVRPPGIRTVRATEPSQT